MAFPAISAVHDGFKVFVVVDASGTYSKMAQEITLARVVQAGVVPVDTAAVASELQKTWNRDNFRDNLGDSGLLRNSKAVVYLGFSPR